MQDAIIRCVGEARGGSQLPKHQNNRPDDNNLHVKTSSSPMVLLLLTIQCSTEDCFNLGTLLYFHYFP